jgi:UDP-glucose 4-epimerase
MNKKILLIGGSGYLGSHLSLFLEKDFDVYVSGTKDSKQSNYFQIEFNNPGTFEVIKNNKFDFVFVLSASIRGLGNKNLENPDLNINTVKLASFLQFLVDEKLTDKVIFTSSMTTYGVDNYMPVTENGKLDPISVYGLSKVIGEQIISFISTQLSIKGLVLRLPGIYGGTRKSGFIYNSILKAIRNENIEIDGENIGYWECIEINDLCVLLRSVILNYEWSKKYEVINIGYGIETDIKHTASFIVTQLSSQSKVYVRGRYHTLYMSDAKRKEISDIDVDFYNSLKNYIEKIAQ